MKRVSILIFIISLTVFKLSAQVSVKDSSIFTPMVGVSYGFYMPGGDMEKRFGNNSAMCLNIDFKTIHNWVLGFNGSYLFGKDIKDRLFDSISTSGNPIISRNGDYGDVRLWERGFTVSASLGRMIAFKRPNPNSGIIINMGFGFMQHKIRIETIGNNVPQLSKSYKKGYDRLCNGFLLSENIGYLYLSNNRLINFYIGLECMQGFTQNRRSWDYELQQKDTHKRMDALFGAKAMWILPLYKKAPQEFYYY